MAENPDVTTQDPHDADEALKKRLLSRIAIAGVMVVALLGGLAVIDALYVTPPQKAEPSEPVAQAPAPEAKPEAKAEEKVEEKVEEKAAEAPGDKPAELAQAEKKEEAKAEVPAEPERTGSIGTPPPRPMRPLTVPATARPAAIRPSEPVAAPHRPEPATEIARTAPAPSSYARHAPASRPLSQAAESSRQYVVQMGVFNNLVNAEELRAKLELAGIPTQIEARVQVGPFKTRQEADAAREKLRALGMETGILTAVKR
ncbi:MAG: SPOR domain-containing protein [Rhodocyclaceae bacterium]|nr:SPOR domain-containing protein [Rhodocyclaceae bacterium]